MLQRQFKLLQTYLALGRLLSSIVCTSSKTKFPVNEETPVFMYKFIFLGIFAARQFKEIILLLDMFI